METKAHQEIKALLEIKVHPETKDSLAIKAIKAIKELLDHLVKKVTKVQQAQ